MASAPKGPLVVLRKVDLVGIGRAGSTPILEFKIEGAHPHLLVGVEHSSLRFLEGLHEDGYALAVKIEIWPVPPAEERLQ